MIVPSPWKRLIEPSRHPNRSVGTGCDSSGMRYVTVVLLPVLSTACGQAPSLPDDAVPGTALRAVVVRVIDGDTLTARVSGRTISIRLIGVDAPEIPHPGSPRPGECFGVAATRALRRLAPAGNVVKVTMDRERFDVYGRSLFYLWTGPGTFVNAELVRTGYARAMVIEPDDAHLGELRAAEAQARRAARGLWTACPGSYPTGSSSGTWAAWPWT
ncbi:MAG: nuc [Actinomycetia bacterium]|nr:nuc [Actinomycetes bacterium]